MTEFEPKETENQKERKEENISNKEVDMTENKLADFYNALGIKTDNEKLQMTGKDLDDQIRIVDELSLRMIKPVDVTEMDETQKDKYESKLEKKIKIYNGVNKITFGKLNPYKYECKVLLKKAIGERDRLKKNLNKYEKELKGTLSGTDKYHQLYTTIWDQLPNYIKEDQQFSNFTGTLKPHVTKNGEDGFRSKYRKIQQESRNLMDLDDILETDIATYESKITGTQEKISKITAQIAETPNDTKLMQSRAKLTSELNTYETEISKFIDWHEDIYEKLADADSELGYMERIIDVNETIVMDTKDSLRNLNLGIKEFQRFIKSKNAVLVYSDHISMVDVAKNRGLQLAGITNMGKAQVYLQLETISDRRASPTDLFGTSQRFQSARDKMYVQRKESIENFKQKLRPKLY